MDLSRRVASEAAKNPCGARRAADALQRQASAMVQSHRVPALLRGKLLAGAAAVVREAPQCPPPAAFAAAPRSVPRAAPVAAPAAATPEAPAAETKGHAKAHGHEQHGDGGHGKGHGKHHGKDEEGGD